MLLQLAFVAQLAARGSHNPKVAGSIPVESMFIPVSLGGQDTRLSPESPGFNSRLGNFFDFFCSEVLWETDKTSFKTFRNEVTVFWNCFVYYKWGMVSFPIIPSRPFG